MAHSTTTKNGTTFHYNSDGSGDVEITVWETRLRVPFEDLIELVGDYVRSERVAELEDLSPRAVLGLPEKG